MWVGRIPCLPRLWPILFLLLPTFAAGCGGSATTSVSAPTSTSTKCAVTITNSTPEIPASGGNGTVAVNTERDCTWAASAQDSWITLKTSSGQGAATVGYTVQTNPNGTRRQGHVVVSEQSVEVSQAAAPCQYSLSPSSADAPAGQTELSVALTATPGCSWNVHSNNDWIGSPSPGSGTGSATLRVLIGANTTPARIGTVTIGDATLRVNQAAANVPAPVPPPPPSPTPSPAPAPSPTPTPTPGPTPSPTPPPAPTPTPTPTCTYSVSPTRISIDASGGQRSVTMAVSQGCTWNATSGANWINVAPASGSGNGSITLSVGVNSGPARTGTVTVASQTVSIEQRATAPCTYAIKPTSYNAGKGPDTINVNVTAGTGCAWTTRSDAAWVTIESGGGSGNGTVRLSIPPNPSAERSTVLTIADQPFNLHQDGGCSYSLKPNRYRTGKRADDITIDVNTDTGCSWTASSPVNWVTVAEGASGTGKGKVRLLVAPNDGPSRTVVLTIAGEPFEIRQDGRD